MIEIGSPEWVGLGFIIGAGLIAIGAKSKSVGTGCFGAFIVVYVAVKYLA